MAEVGDDVLEAGPRLEKDEGVGFVWVGGFLEDVEYCYAGFGGFSMGGGGGRERRREETYMGVLKLRPQTARPPVLVDLALK